MQRRGGTNRLGSAKLGDGSIQHVDVVEEVDDCISMQPEDEDSDQLVLPKENNTSSPPLSSLSSSSRPISFSSRD